MRFFSLFLSLSFLKRARRHHRRHFDSSPRVYKKKQRKTNEQQPSGLCIGQRAPSDVSQCCDSLWLPSFVIRNADEMPQGRLQPYYITVDDASGVVTWRVEFRSNFYTSLDVQAFVSCFCFLVFGFWFWRWWLWWLEVKKNRTTLTSFLSLFRPYFPIIQCSPSILRWVLSSVFGFAER